ncbi:MAG: sulfur oxidation c-type cytochrome SoxX [Acidiferrobacterales bacterium]|nr:sulfur oxidation c-type cytochrome SoxX [Acidiferrobacterales bacterium]
MKKILISLISLIAIAVVPALSFSPVYADSMQDLIAEGKELSFNRQKGNCLSCHIIEDGLMPGTHGPPLIFMQRRFPDKGKLRARIYDPTAANPNTMMPPFGLHGILTDSEIDAITEYIFTL